MVEIFRNTKRDTCSWKGKLKNETLGNPKLNWKDWSWKVRAEVEKFELKLETVSWSWKAWGDVVKYNWSCKVQLKLESTTEVGKYNWKRNFPTSLGSCHLRSGFPTSLASFQHKENCYNLTLFNCPFQLHVSLQKLYSPDWRSNVEITLEVFFIFLTVFFISFFINLGRISFLSTKVTVSFIPMLLNHHQKLFELLFS